MKKLILSLLSLVLLPPQFCAAQGVFIPPQTAFRVVNGVTAPIANATITVCAAGASGIPCSPALVNTIFKDQALTQPLTNPFTADATGNYQFAAAPGTYTVTTTSLGFAGYSYQVTLAGGSGSGITGSGTPGFLSQFAGSTSLGNSCLKNNGDGTITFSCPFAENFVGLLVSGTGTPALTPFEIQVRDAGVPIELLTSAAVSSAFGVAGGGITLQTGSSFTGVANGANCSLQGGLDSETGSLPQGGQLTCSGGTTNASGGHGGALSFQGGGDNSGTGGNVTMGGGSGSSFNTQGSVALQRGVFYPTELPFSSLGTPPNNPFFAFAKGATIYCFDCKGPQDGAVSGSVAVASGTGAEVIYDGTAWRVANGLGGSGAVASVSNSDSTLIISPTTGPVVASLNLANPNTWTATQTFPNASIAIAKLNATGTPSSTTFLRGDGTWNTPAGGGNVSTSGTPATGQYAKFASSTTIGGQTGVPFGDLTSTPTTLAGYGITDAVPNTRTVNGHALSANVTVTASDVGAPGLATANTYSGGGVQDLSAMKLKPPTTTVASLPTASSNTNIVYEVTDGASATDCTTGGSSTRVWCSSNGAAWVAMAGSGGASPGGSTDALQYNAGGSFGGVNSPTTNGTYYVQYKVTASAAVVPSATVAGIAVDAQSSATPSVADPTDRAALLETTNGTTSTATSVPSAASLGSNFPFVTCNLGSVINTVTPATSTVNGNATQKLVSKVSGHNPECSFWWSDNTNYFSAEILPTDANGQIADEGLPTKITGASCGDATHSCGLSVDNQGRVTAISNNVISGGSGLSGMTAGQVPIAATPTTVTSSKPLAGAGAGIVTGPTTSASGDVPTYTGTAGQTQDSGTLLSNIPTMAANGGAGNLVQTAGASKALSDAAVAVANVTQTTATPAANQICVYGSTAKTCTPTTTLPTAAIPALTGDVTNTAGSTATTVNKISGTSPGTNAVAAFGVSDTTFTNATTAIGANACSASAVTVTMTGVTTSMAFVISPSTDVSGSTGWGSSGGLVIDAWPTANTLNYKICNQTASSITPAAVTWNVGVR